MSEKKAKMVNVDFLNQTATQQQIVGMAYELGKDKLTLSQLRAAWPCFQGAILLLMQKNMVIPFYRVGKLKPVISNPRVARNPSTGEAVSVPPRLRYKFKMAQSLRDFLNDYVLPENWREAVAKENKEDLEEENVNE